MYSRAAMLTEQAHGDDVNIWYFQEVNIEQEIMAQCLCVCVCAVRSCKMLLSARLDCVGSTYRQLFRIHSHVLDVGGVLPI